MSEKYTPTRMCIVCRNRFPKHDLVRIVKSKNGILKVDKKQKLDGRGCYLCGSEECMKKLIKSRSLNRTFKQDIPVEVYENIKKEIENIDAE